MCGPAVTVRTYPGDWAKPVEAIDECTAGDVLVIDAVQQLPGHLGRARHPQRQGQGTGRSRRVGRHPRHARDRPHRLSGLLAAWSRPTPASPRASARSTCRSLIAGQTVDPGDWVVGDDDGVIVLPRAQAVELANRAMDVLEKENRLRGEIDAGKTLAEVAYLQKWEKR